MWPPGFPKKSPKALSDAPRRLFAAAAAAVVVVLLGSAGAAARQERGPSPTSADELRGAIAKLGDLDYGIRSKAGRVIRRAPAAAGCASAAAGVTRARGWVHPIPQPGPADRLQRSAHRGRRCRRRWPRRTIGCERSHTATSSINPDRALAAALSGGARARRPASSSGRRSFARWRRSATMPKVREALLVRRPARRRLFPQHGHRGAGRLQADRTRCRSSPKSPMLEGPLQDDAVMALGKSGREAGAGHAREPAAHGQQGTAADGGGGDLPGRASTARRTSATWRRSSDSQTIILAIRISSARRRRASATSRSEEMRTRSTSLFDVRHPVERSDSRAAGARGW